MRSNYHNIRYKVWSKLKFSLEFCVLHVNIHKNLVCVLIPVDIKQNVKFNLSPEMDQSPPAWVPKSWVNKAPSSQKLPICASCQPHRERYINIHFCLQLHSPAFHLKGQSVFYYVHLGRLIWGRNFGRINPGKT